MPGHDEQSCVNLAGKRPSAGDDAAAPGQAAAASAAAATAAATAASAAAAAATASAAAAATSAAATPAAAAAGILLAGPVHASAFLVKNEKGPERHVGDLFLGESEFVIRHDVLGRYIRRHPRSRRCGCAARQRQRHPNSSQYRYGFLHSPSLRRSLRLPHVRSSNAYHEMVVARVRVRLDQQPCKSDCVHRLRDSLPLWRRSKVPALMQRTPIQRLLLESRGSHGFMNTHSGSVHEYLFSVNRAAGPRTCHTAAFGVSLYAG
jgi:hypothetical protein